MYIREARGAQSRGAAQDLANLSRYFTRGNPSSSVFLGGLFTEKTLEDVESSI